MKISKITLVKFAILPICLALFPFLLGQIRDSQRLEKHSALLYLYFFFVETSDDDLEEAEKDIEILEVVKDPRLKTGDYQAYKLLFDGVNEGALHPPDESQRRKGVLCIWKVYEGELWLCSGGEIRFRR